MDERGLKLLLDDMNWIFLNKSMKFSVRPSNGSAGVQCVVKANHCSVELEYRNLYQYEVSITPKVATSRGNHSVFKHVMNQVAWAYHQPSVYNGKSLYTVGPLSFLTKEFMTYEDDESGVPREFKVVIKLATSCAEEGGKASAPQGDLHFLNSFLRQLPAMMYCPVGHSFYSPCLGQVHQIGKGLESWSGFYQSIRQVQMGLSLNIDVFSTAFMEPLPVIKFVMQLLERDDSSRPLSPAHRSKVEKALRGVKVEVTHHENLHRKYRIFGLTSQATRELTFGADDSGTIKSVVEYFREEYGLVIQHIQWPCLQVGNQQRLIYLPMEVCKIVEGQRYTKRLDETQLTALRKVTCQHPRQRENDIINAIHRNSHDRDSYSDAFGIKISNHLVSVEARILPSPLLKYHETGRERDCLPKVGQWNMRDKKLVNGGVVKNWICIDFAGLLACTVDIFLYHIGDTCNNFGMAFNPEPVLPTLAVLISYPVERVLKDQVRDAMVKLHGKKLDLLIAILPCRRIQRSVYGDLKKICETELGIVSQCILPEHVTKMKRQCLINVALKINVKVGGRNTVLVDALSRRLPVVSVKPTIIFGADVAHPHPGDDSSPSIAAVVASQDWPLITNYAALFCAQAHRQELIEDLFNNVTGGSMIKEHLISFHRATGKKPESIIFYRDGVSEGQFYQVLLYELGAIRKACASLEPNYQPPITFVVVQKRHRTRLFANDHGDQNSVDQSGNILPGTVVDSKICHPTEFDFYLCSHAGIQGTSRPTHYHVLFDDNKFTADALQSLTNNLCYTYARCTRSVSIVPPVYYAHLAASRARLYMEPETSDSGSMTDREATVHGGTRGFGGRSTQVPGANASVRSLPSLKENLKKVMFYC